MDLLWNWTADWVLGMVFLRLGWNYYSGHDSADGLGFVGWEPEFRQRSGISACAWDGHLTADLGLIIGSWAF